MLRGFQVFLSGIGVVAMMFVGASFADAQEPAAAVVREMDRLHRIDTGMSPDGALPDSVYTNSVVTDRGAGAGTGHVAAIV